MERASEGKDPEETLRERLTGYFTARPELGVDSVYLFGSHAEGRAHRESDIDVAVLLSWKRYPSARERFEARVTLGSDLIAVLHHNEVDVVILNDLPPLFGRRILWEGIRLFLGDADADFDHRLQVQSRAADLAPWLEKMERIKLAALRR
jgi:predicted nucleotidyltransferase